MRPKPKKSLGQNFLLDKNIQHKIIAACDLRPNDVVLEIGSGTGALTSLLAGCVKKLYAVEIDARLIPLLSDSLKDVRNVDIVCQDILKFDFKSFFKIESTPVIKVIGNIPYYISTPIIERLLEHRIRIRDVYLTVQKEFAQRIIASPGSKEYGSLSVFIQYFAAPDVLFIIKKNCFRPVPKVDSSFLHLAIHESPPVRLKNEKTFFAIIRAAFNKRRKTLRNSLKGIVTEETLQAFFKQCALTSTVRPECLSLKEFAALADLHSSAFSNRNSL